MIELRRKNSQLEAEVARLQAQVVQLKGQAADMDVLAALVNFSRANPENAYSAAAVIGRDPVHFSAISSSTKARTTDCGAGCRS